MSGLACTCSGRTCSAGSVGLGRIRHVGNGQGNGGGKAVTFKAQLLPCSLPCRESGSQTTAGAEGWGTERVCALRDPGGNCALLLHLNTGHSLVWATGKDPF